MQTAIVTGAPLPLFHHPDYVAALPTGHSFPMAKYALLLPALADAGRDFLGLEILSEVSG